MKIKIGIDIHGVIDQRPKFWKAFVDALPKDKFEIHVITGIKQEFDTFVDFQWDFWFSLHDECERLGMDITYDEKGRPWVDPTKWDVLKAKYCKEQGIHLMFDDSPVYGQFFSNETMYFRNENANRDNWRHR